nr:PREDICTED: uncharacterized protein LOC109031068 [Bemisia tabaci]
MRSCVFLAGLLVLCAAACNAFGDDKLTKPNVGPSFKLLVASLNTLEKYRTMPGLTAAEQGRRDETVAKLVELQVKELTELVPNWEKLFKAEERNGDGTQTRFIEFIIPVIQAVASGIGVFTKSIPAIISGINLVCQLLYP